MSRAVGLRGLVLGVVACFSTACGSELAHRARAPASSVTTSAEMPVSSQRAAPAPACVDGELARLGEEAFDDARARALDALIAGNFDDAVAAFDDAQRLRADNLASVALGAGSQALLEASRAEGGRRAEAARKLRIAGPPRSATMPSERRVVLRQASRSTSRSEPESKRMPPPPDVPVVDGRLGRRVIATSSWRIVVGRPHLTVELGERITVFEYTDALKAERQRIDIGGAWLESGVLMLEAVDGGRSSVERSRLLGVDAATGALLWIRGPHHRTSGMVGGDGILYAAFGVEFGRYRVEALDVRTGTLLHSMPLDAAPRALSASAAGIVVGTDGGSIAISIEGAMSPEAATAPFRRPTAPQQEMARVRCQSMAAVRAFDARDPAAIAPAVDALDAAGAPRAFVRELRAAGARLEAANEGRAVDLTTRAPVLLARAPTTKLPLPRCSPVRLTETWSEWQTPAEASAVAASFGVEGTRQKRFERAIRGPAAELPPKYAGRALFGQVRHGDASTLLYGSSMAWLDERGRASTFRVPGGLLLRDAEPEVIDGLLFDGRLLISVRDFRAGNDKQLFAFDAASGAMTWRSELHADDLGIAGGHLVVVSDRIQTLSVLCPADGSVLARAKLSGRPRDMVLDGARVLVRSADGGQAFSVSSLK